MHKLKMVVCSLRHGYFSGAIMKQTPMAIPSTAEWQQISVLRGFNVHRAPRPKVDLTVYLCQTVKAQTAMTPVKQVVDSPETQW